MHSRFIHALDNRTRLWTPCCLLIPVLFNAIRSRKFNSEATLFCGTRCARGSLMRIERKFPWAFQRGRRVRRAHYPSGPGRATCRDGEQRLPQVHKPYHPLSAVLDSPFLPFASCSRPYACSAIFIYEDLSDDVKLLATRSAGINRTRRALCVHELRMPPR